MLLEKCLFAANARLWGYESGGRPCAGASFSQKGNADKLARKLSDKAYDAYVVSAKVKGRTWYRVWVGHPASQDEAKQMLLTLKERENYRKAFITSQRLNLKYDP